MGRGDKSSPEELGERRRGAAGGAMALDWRTPKPYAAPMPIERIRHKGLRRLYEDDDPKGLPAAHAGKIRRILFALDNAAGLAELQTMPGWKLHPLKGDRQGRYGLTVTGNRRVTFAVEDRFTDLDYEDYH